MIKAPILAFDRGDAWQDVHTMAMQGYFVAIAFDPMTPNRLAVGSVQGGWFVSDDFGDSWESGPTGFLAFRLRIFEAATQRQHGDFGPRLAFQSSGLRSLNE
ncbi:hypothetical protein ACFL6C_10255 [Myxococcota bacterium]